MLGKYSSFLHEIAKGACFVFLDKIFLIHSEPVLSIPEQCTVYVIVFRLQLKRQACCYLKSSCSLYKLNVSTW